MAKQSVTNTARGPRGVNVFTGPKNSKTDERPTEVVIINPGETRDDLELVDVDHPVLKGWIDTHELVLGEYDPEDVGEEEQEEIEAARFENDPIIRMTQESARQAGNTEGLADRPRERPVTARARPTAARGGRGGARKPKSDDEE